MTIRLKWKVQKTGLPDIYQVLIAGQVVGRVTPAPGQPRKPNGRAKWFTHSLNSYKHVSFFGHLRAAEACADTIERKRMTMESIEQMNRRSVTR